MTDQQEGPLIGLQELRSEVEVDERRALLRASWGHWSGTHEQALLDILNAAWFQGLTLIEVEQLSAVEGWSWGAFTDWETEPDWDPPREPTVNELVEFVLRRNASGLLAYAVEWAWDDLCEEGDLITETISLIRRLANSYGFSVPDIAHRVGRSS